MLLCMQSAQTAQSDIAGPLGGGTMGYVYVGLIAVQLYCLCELY